MKISVVIPAYNAEKYLVQALESTINQIYIDENIETEIIVVDDQSTDCTSSILESYKSKIKIFNTKDIGDKGIVAALNYGIEKATGDLIARMDADDMMEPNRLQTQAKVFKNPEVMLCATNASIIGEDNQNLGHIISSVSNLNVLDYICGIVHPTTMFRASLFKEHGLKYKKEFEYAEDYELWLHLRSLFPNNSYVHINEPLLKYRVAGNERISSKFKKEQREKTKQIHALYKCQPYLSIINLGDENQLLQDLENFNYSYEITDNPKGKYVAFSKDQNLINRFEYQVEFLEKNSEYVGCGGYVNIDEGTFFFSSDEHAIEAELLKGNSIIEQSSFMYRNVINFNEDFFKLLCQLLPYGYLTNIKAPLVKIPGYKGTTTENFVERIQKAKQSYRHIVNIVHLNITSDGNFSGVDRYLKTLEDSYPSNIRCFRITLKVGNKDLSVNTENKQHCIITYNADKIPLEHLNDIIWDNCSYMFKNKKNLLVQSNCLNLYSTINWLRQKATFKHICMLHCIPYREAIRRDRDKFAQREQEFLDFSKPFKEESWEMEAINAADHVILNTKDAEFYYNRVGYLPNYSVIYNGIEKLGHCLVKKEKEDPFRFIFVGHSSMLKGFDQLLPIIEEVSKKHKIEIYWAGHASEELTSIIQTKKLPVLIQGVLPPEKLNELYKYMDCALIASACETCSYAAIEALSAGLPIIATKVHGVEEIVNEVGLLIDMDTRGIINKDMYIEAMCKVIENDDLRKAMENRAVQSFDKYYKDNMVKQCIDLYQKLLSC